MTDERPRCEHPRPPTTAQVLLGLFVVGQLVFLFAANLLGLLENSRSRLKDQAIVEKLMPGWARQEGHINDAVQVVTGLTNRWAQVTGQPQEWSLFAPDVATQVPFPAVELRWDDATPLAAGPAVLLLSENEPADVNRFFRTGKFRLRRYEASLDIALHIPEGKSADDQWDEWRTRIEKHVRERGPEIRAYLRLRVWAFLAAHPERPPPRQVIMLSRLYLIPPPDAERRPWAWELNSVQPIARWRPDAPPGAGSLSLEWYDPLFRRFERLD